MQGGRTQKYREYFKDDNIAKPNNSPLYGALYSDCIVYTKQSNRSFVKINLINSATSTDGGVYVDAKDRAILIMSKFAIMQHADREEEERKSGYFDAAEQIKKYKELLDCGAITKDEFEEAKKRLFKSF